MQLMTREKTSEENHKADVGGKKDSGRERREWTPLNKGDMCNLVCENAVLELGRRGGWLNSKRNLGEK